MIFQHDMIAVIRDRRKSQTRRPVKVIREYPLKHESKCRYRVGEVYKVQATAEWTAARLAAHRRQMEAREPSRARAVLAYLDSPIQAAYPKGRALTTDLLITILDVRQEKLGEITPQDAKREGFRFTAQFFERWQELHHPPRGQEVDRDTLVWVISFGVGDLRGHFDRPNLLAARPGREEYERIPGSRRVRIKPTAEEHQDYTEDPKLAMPGEPEAISKTDAATFTRYARARDAKRASDPDVALRNELVAALERWQERSGGVTDRDRERTIRGIQRQLAALDRKLKAA